MVGTVGRLILVQPAVSSAAGWLLDVAGGDAVLRAGVEKELVPQPGELGRGGHVLVRVDARGLHPAVPHIAVEIVAVGARYGHRDRLEADAAEQDEHHRRPPRHLPQQPGGGEEGQPGTDDERQRAELRRIEAGPHDQQQQHRRHRKGQADRGHPQFSVHNSVTGVRSAHTCAAPDGREPPSVDRPDLDLAETGVVGHVGDVVGADVGPREPGAGRTPVAQPDVLAPQRRAGRLELDDGAALRREQFGDPAEQGGRVAADPDVPVREQHRGPPAGARHPVEHVAQHDQRARGPGQVDRVRGDVDAEGRDATFGQRDGQPAWSGADVEGRALAPVQDRLVARALVQPALHRERPAASVGVLDLRPRPAGQRVLVEFPDHAGSPP